MLPASARLTSRDDFAEVIRRGRRAGRAVLVVHALVPDQHPTESPATRSTVGPSRSRVEGGLPQDQRATEAALVNRSPRVGFVVSKAVGGSVVRHRVVRRLRHVLRDRLDQLPPGTRLVVRALPHSATVDSARLGAEVDRALRAVLPARERG